MSEQHLPGSFEVEAPNSDAALRRAEISAALSPPAGVDVVALVNEKPRSFPTADLIGMERGDISVLGGDNAS